LTLIFFIIFALQLILLVGFNHVNAVGGVYSKVFFNSLFRKSHVVYFGRQKVLNTDFCNYRSTEVT
jgi:hypothetical protein